MAERRMFAKTIVESDAFLSQSIKAQCLYYQLNMKADDDGFLNNALTICKSLGFTKKILDELIDNRFLLDLGDGITTIKHWLINNRIQRDRYHPTIYQDKYELLSIKDDKAYTFKSKVGTNMDTNRTTSGQQMDTEVSIGKFSIDKVSIDKFSDDDIQIKNINERILESGYDSAIIEKALNIYSNKNYPKTTGFYQRIINTLTNDEIYDKEAYISEIARNLYDKEAIS